MYKVRKGTLFLPNLSPMLPVSTTFASFMIIIRSSDALQTHILKLRRNGKTIGFVPTMGALHPGHLSLVENAQKQNDIVVASIFVNPTQFNDPKDFKLYPRTTEQDIYLLEKTGCNTLFLPSTDDIYPAGTAQLPHYELGYLETILEGKYRPGHFQGVCQVVDRLMTLVAPERLYLGQKDYQQCMVLKKLLSLTGSSAQIEICPTLREADGLAMSSRNVRLDNRERSLATGIFRTLTFISRELQPGSLTTLKERALQLLSEHHFRPDYIEIADAGTLQLQAAWDGKKKVVALIAAFMGEVRLIDNMILPLNFANYAN